MAKNWLTQIKYLTYFPHFRKLCNMQKIRIYAKCNDNSFCWFCRCLLNTKAAKVMKIIRDMFGLILQFRTLLVAADWTRDKTTGEMSHANFNQMLKCFQNFKQYSVFLFKGRNFYELHVSRIYARSLHGNVSAILKYYNFQHK